MVMNIILCFCNRPVCTLAKRNSGILKIAADRTVVDLFLLFDNLPARTVTSRPLCKSCSEAAADILCFGNLPTCALARRNFQV